jgi:aromatic ring-opening dioxygenase catalytic subunit (LigB family)
MTSAHRMPTIYLPHGGGPWPFMDLSPMIGRGETEPLAAYLKGIPATLPAPPRALLVVSAHWEESIPTLMTHPHPPMFYDYYGFPPETYRITWPAPGEPVLAARVRGLLEAAGIPSGEDPSRGFDHGTFVPLKLTYPSADVPTVQLSLEAGLDPGRHLAIGKALAPLRDEGVLIVGSGMSYHNLRRMQGSGAAEESVPFDDWLAGVIVDEPSSRDASLVGWTKAPLARQVHPREEHLIPLMVVAGAAGADRGRVPYRGSFARARISAAHFA